MRRKISFFLIPLLLTFSIIGCNQKEKQTTPSQSPKNTLNKNVYEEVYESTFKTNNPNTIIVDKLYADVTNDGVKELAIAFYKPNSKDVGIAITGSQGTALFNLGVEEKYYVFADAPFLKAENNDKIVFPLLNTKTNRIRMVDIKCQDNLFTIEDYKKN